MPVKVHEAAVTTSVVTAEVVVVVVAALQGPAETVLSWTEVLATHVWMDR